MDNALREASGRAGYLSYLLRLWRDTGSDRSRHSEEPPAWRASLESSRSGQRRVFADLDELVAFLRRQTGGGSELSKDKGMVKQEWPPTTQE